MLAEDFKALEGREMLERLKAAATWNDLGTLILARDRPGELLPDSHGQANPSNRLTERWMSTWRLHGPRLWEAAKLVATEEGTSVEQIKRRALQRGIYSALHDAEKPQVTRIGPDRAWRAQGDCRIGFCSFDQRWTQARPINMQGSTR